MQGRLLFLKELGTVQKLALLIIVAFVARLYVVFSAASITNDSVTYLFLAGEFATGNYGGILSVERPPLYPFMIWLFSLVFGDLELSGRMVSLFFGSLLIPAVFYLGKSLYGERVALYAAFFATVHPYFIRYSGDVLTESLYHFVFVLAVLAALKGVTLRSHKWMFLTGLLTLFAYLIKPVGMGVLIVTSLWIVLYRPKIAWREVRERAVLLASGWAVFIFLALPYLIYIFLDTGTLPLTGTGKLDAMQVFSSVAAGLFSAGRVMEVIKYLPEAFTYPFLPFFIWWVVRRFKEGLTEGERFLLVIALAYFLVYYGILPRRRYFIQLMPVMLVFSAMGLIYFREWLKGQRRLPTAAVFAALVLAITTAQLSKGMVKIHKSHLPERLAGEFIMKEYGEGVKIMGRKPVITYYSGGTLVQIPKRGSRSFRWIIKKAEAEGSTLLVDYKRSISGYIKDFDENKEKLIKVKEFKVGEGKEMIIYSLPSRS